MENIDWGSLGFNYMKTDFNARYTCTDGKWSEMEITSDEYINMHMSASCLHYGTALFEGLKAFRGADGKVRLFRVEENAKRLQSSAKRLCLPVPTIDMIVKAPAIIFPAWSPVSDHVTELTPNLSKWIYKFRHILLFLCSSPAKIHK